MGFGDDFKIVCTDTETYKQAGNSIIVNVLIAILKKLNITQYAE
jgi:DNA (cytosine-5)-methyltransferase 1